MDQSLFSQLPKNLRQKIHLIQIRIVGKLKNERQQMICGHISRAQCLAYCERTTSQINGEHYILISYFYGLVLIKQREVYVDNQRKFVAFNV